MSYLNKCLLFAAFIAASGCTAYTEIGAHHAVNLAEPTVGSFELGLRTSGANYLECSYTHYSELMNGFPFNNAHVPDLMNIYGCKAGMEFDIMRP